MEISNQINQLKAMVELDQFKSKKAGHVKIQYREVTTNSVINFSKTYDGSLSELADQINISSKLLYTWRHRLGVKGATKRGRYTKKRTRKAPNLGVVHRLKGQIEQHENDIARIKKQLELVRLADQLNMQIDFE
jgi:transposase-like protein